MSETTRTCGECVCCPCVGDEVAVCEPIGGMRMQVTRSRDATRSICFTTAEEAEYVARLLKRYDESARSSIAACATAAERQACLEDCYAEARDDGTAQRIIARIQARATKGGPS